MRYCSNYPKQQINAIRYINFTLGIMKNTIQNTLTTLHNLVKEKITHIAVKLLIAVLGLALKLAYEKRLTIRGDFIWKELEGKPVLLVANHASHLDFMILLDVIDRRFQRDISFLAKKELWERLLWRMLMKHGNSIPVDRTHFTVGSMRAIKKVFANNGLLGMFPEGTRSDGKYMGLIKPGLEFIIRKYPHITYVPCGLEGFYEAWPKGQRLTWPLPKGHQLNIAFGQPRSFTESGATTAAEFAEQLMNEVAQLSNQPKPTFIIRTSPHSDTQQ